MSKKAGSSAPITQSDKDRRQCQHLSDFNAHIEADDVGDESILRECKFLKLRRQSKAMEQAEDQDRDARVRLKPEETLESVHVVEGFVDNRKPDDGVDKIRVGMDPAQHASQQSDAVSDREKADVCDDIFQPVEKKDHAYQEKQMV